MKPKPHMNRPPAGAPKSAAPKSTAPSTDWNDVADWYDQHVGDTGSEFHREVVLPNTLRLLALQPGDRALDIACGQGVLCRLLASKGVEATGIDAAPELIRAAKDRNNSPSTSLSFDSALSTQHGSAPLTTGSALPTYHLGDARELDFLPADHFTAAACVLAIQNINPINPVFTGVARALKPHGKFVLVMMHPCFRGPKETQWGWDDQEKVQYRRVDRYLLPRKSPIVTHPGKDPGKYTWSFHKPVENYVKSLRNAGLLIDAIEEWPSHKKSTSGPRAPAENIAREEIPMFMAIRALKIA